MLQNKFKERPPSETVEIIRNFFQERGYEIHTEKIEKNEIDCYTTCYTLNLNGQNILYANGKGVNEEFAAASGHAELYERFCNKMPYIFNHYFINNLMVKNYNENNFYFHCDEKISQNCLECFSIKEFFDYLIPNQNLRSLYFKTFFNNKFFLMPYEDLDKKNVYYFDPRITTMVSGSTGMAAGNTLDEALNQGISEILERYVFDLYCKINQKDKYYLLDLQKLNTTESNKKIISYLKEKYELYIFDLSYNYNLPVVLTVLVDKINMRIHPSFGSFPVFDIALERTLTELYQGINNYHNNIYTSNLLQKPYQDKYYYDNEILYFSNYAHSPIFNQNLFINSSYIDSPSSIFLNKNATNSDILSYYKDILKKEQIDLVFIENGLCENMFSVHIFCMNKNILHCTLEGLNKEVVQKNNYQMIINHMINNHQNFLSLLQGKINKILPIDEDFIHYKYNDIYNFLLYPFENWNIYLMQGNKNTSFSLFKLLLNFSDNDLNFMNNLAQGSIFYSKVKKYIFLLKYNKQMDNDNLIAFCNTIGFSNITYEDIININNREYWINQIFIETINEQINSQTYQQLLKSFQK